MVEELFTIEVREKLHMGLWLTIKDLVLPNPHRDMALMNSPFLRMIQTMRWLASEAILRNSLDMEQGKEE